MQIHNNHHTINNIQNNLFKNAHIVNTNSKQNDNNHSSATLELSQHSMDKYFEKGIFGNNRSKDFILNVSADNTYSSDLVKEYGQKYAEVYEKIMANVDDNKKGEYIEKLDAAFEKAISKESQDMLSKINKLSDSNNKELPFDKDAFNKLFKDVAHAVKDYYVDNASEPISKYIDTKVGFSDRSDFKTYKAFSTVMDIVDITDDLMNKMNTQKYMLTKYSPDEIINSKDIYKSIMSRSEVASNAMEKLGKLYDSISEDELGDTIKNGLMKALKQKEHKLNDMNGKMQRYTEYLEEYKKIQEKIQKATAKRDKLSVKLDKANEAKNQDLVKMYLKSVATQDNEIANLKAKSAEIEAKMAGLLKDINDMDVSE
jgi:hypothetical protein